MKLILFAAIFYGGIYSLTAQGVEVISGSTGDRAIKSTASGVQAWAVLGEAYGFNGHGIVGLASNNEGRGVMGQGLIGVEGSTSSATGVGVYGSATGGGTAIKGVTILSGYGIHGKSTNATAIFGESENGNGVVGRTFGDSGFDFYAENPTAARNYGSASSRRWKRNIRNIPDALNKLISLRGVYFNWDQEHGGGHSIGFIAEEIGKVLPEIVVYEENGIDAIGMDYSKITPLLVEATNEMHRLYERKITDQEKRIGDLEKEIEILKQLINVKSVGPTSED